MPHQEVLSVKLSGTYHSSSVHEHSLLREVEKIEIIYASVLQSSSKGLCQNLVVLVGGFETKTGEQVFRYQMPESIMLLFSFIRIKMSLFCAVACFSE